MKTLILQRAEKGERGTFGHLRITTHTGSHSWTSCERAPEPDPHPCIPAGTYPLALGMYYHGDGPGGKPDYPAYEVLTVPGRSQIKLHRANFPKELLGCIAPGMGYFKDEKGLYGVTDSKGAFEALMDALGSDPNAELVVLDPPDVAGGEAS